MKRITICIILFAILVSCSVVSTPDNDTPESLQPTQSIPVSTIPFTPVSESAITPALTPTMGLEVSPTIMPSPSSTVESINIPILPLKRISLTNWEFGGQDYLGEGILVLVDLASPSNPCHFLYLSTGEDYPMDTKISCDSVSPDRLRISGYNKTGDNFRLVVLNNKQELLSTDILKENWFLPLGWISDDYLLIQSRMVSLNAVLFDPRNKTEISVPDQFPNRVTDYPIDVTRSSGAAGVFYSPQTDYVVYQIWDETIEGWYYAFALYDWKNQREIARVPLGYPLFPQWSPDGREVVVVAGRDYTGSPSPGFLMPDELSFEIFRMSIDGDVDQVTSLGTMFQGYKIYDLSWSPDGTRLAFLLEIEESSHPCSKKCIVIIDLSTLAMASYMMPEGYYVKVSNWVDTIIWSPQGDQLLLPAQNDNPNLVMIFDIAKEIVFEVAKDARIIGWMRAAP